MDWLGENAARTAKNAFCPAKKRRRLGRQRRSFVSFALESGLLQKPVCGFASPPFGPVPGPKSGTWGTLFDTTARAET
jgi:hypothetical protein